MLDSRKRTLLKTLTDKVMEIGLSFLIMKALGLSLELSLGLPILLEFLQIGVYVLNERIWSKVKWETSHEGHLCEKCKVPTCECPFGRHED